MVKRITQAFLISLTFCLLFPLNSFADATRFKTTLPLDQLLYLTDYFPQQQSMACWRSKERT